MVRTGVRLFFLLFCLTFLFSCFSRSSNATQTSTPVSPQQSSIPAAASASANSTLQSTPSKKITEYTLPPDLYRKSHNRSRIGFASQIFGFFYSLFVLWFILKRKLSTKFRDWAERASSNRFVQAFVFIPILVLTIALFHLPLGIFSESVLKIYKISVQSWPSWLGDWAKGQFITILLGSFLAWLLYAVIRKSPRRWWLYFWIMSLPILLFVVFVSPYVIDPMFNKYEPLSTKAPQIIPDLQNLTRRAGQEIPPERMFWMMASDKTISTNASVNGFGASKRIIIWDTTLAQETTDEVLADFGHELGHYVLGHIWKGFLFFSALILILMYLGYRSIGSLLARSGAAWGIRGLDDWASFPALLLLLTLFGFVAGVAGSTFSRFEENQADVYGLEVTHGIIPDPAQACAKSFQIYGEAVLVDPDPNPVQVFLYYDHPAVRDRIHLCVTYDAWSAGHSPQFVK